MPNKPCHYHGSIRGVLGLLGQAAPGSYPPLEMRLRASPWLAGVQVPLAVSILISSDFLQMRPLVDECLKFVGEHLTEIVKLPIDLSCLKDKMVLQLAKVSSWTLPRCAVNQNASLKLEREGVSVSPLLGRLTHPTRETRSNSLSYQRPRPVWSTFSAPVTDQLDRKTHFPPHGRCSLKTMDFHPFP